MPASDVCLFDYPINQKKRYLGSPFPLVFGLGQLSHYAPGCRLRKGSKFLHRRIFRHNVGVTTVKPRGHCRPQLVEVLCGHQLTNEFLNVRFLQVVPHCRLYLVVRIPCADDGGDNRGVVADADGQRHGCRHPLRWRILTRPFLRLFLVSVHIDGYLRLATIVAYHVKRRTFLPSPFCLLHNIALLC